MQRFFVEPYQIQEEEHRNFHYEGRKSHPKRSPHEDRGRTLDQRRRRKRILLYDRKLLEEEEVILHISLRQEPEYELPWKDLPLSGTSKSR